MAGVEYIGIGRWRTPMSGVVSITISSVVSAGMSFVKVLSVRWVANPVYGKEEGMKKEGGGSEVREANAELRARREMRR
jgi:hypothetical protein